MFESILSSKVSTRLLLLISRKPYESVYLSGLARDAKTGIGTTKASLDRLLGKGILSKSAESNRIVYQLNPESSIALELVRLAHFDALLGLPERYQSAIIGLLKKAKKCLGNDLSALVVYGSVAKGTAKSGSDIDILIITKRKLGRKARNRLGEVVRAVSDSFSALPEEKLMSEASFKESYYLGDDFLVNVLKDGILVYDADGYYTSFLMHGIPKATRAMIEKKLETAERWLESASESYRERPVVSATLLGVVSIHLSRAFLLLKHVQPGSRHEIPTQLISAGDRKFAKVYRRTREWENDPPLEADKEEVWEYLSFLKEKNGECMRMLQSWS